MATFPLLEAYVKLRREVSLIGSLKLKAMDLGQKQMQILYRLTQSPCSMGELADFTQSDKASITRTVEALFKAGWIKRDNADGDRRKCIIHLTSRGEVKARKAHEVRKYIGEQLEETLSAKERETLTHLLNKVATALVEQRN